MYISAIFDKKAECYLNPFAARALGEAQRIFQDAIADKNSGNPLSVHPEDFDLYEIGLFDTVTGEIVRVDAPQPKLLVRGEAFSTK